MSHYIRDCPHQTTYQQDNRHRNLSPRANYPSQYSRVEPTKSPPRQTGSNSPSRMQNTSYRNHQAGGLGSPSVSPKSFKPIRGGAGGHIPPTSQVGLETVASGVPGSILRDGTAGKRGREKGMHFLDTQCREIFVNANCQELTMNNEHSFFSPVITAVVQNKRVAALVDTGSQVTILSEQVYNSLTEKPELAEIVSLRMAGEQVLSGRVARKVNISIGEEHFMWDVYVAPIVDSFILGIDFMNRFEVKLDLKNGIFKIKGYRESLLMKRNNETPYEVSRVWTGKKVVIPPNTGINLQARTRLNSGKEFVISPATYNKGLFVSNTLVYGHPEVYVRVLNCSDRPVHLSGDYTLGYATEIQETTPEHNGICSQIGYKQNKSDITDPISNTPIDRAELPDHLIDLFHRSGEHLSESEKKELRQLLIEYQDIFSRGPTDLGCFQEITHKIDLYDHARPVRQPLRRVPIGFEGEEEANLKTLLDTGVIQESNSEWASAPVLIRKRDGSVRYCVDFRVVNSMTVKDAFGIPSISQCLDQLEGCTMYSCLDLASGYHQIMVDEKDRHKTAFITKYGLFEHRRMAFGLCNAPATFMRVMGLVLRGLTWKHILAYLDDVIVLGRGFPDQLAHLKTTFDRFRKYNLKLKPKKCDLFRKEVTFLGKHVSPEGISLNPENVKKVKNWPVPKNSKDVERFLGFANYHRDHIKEYSHMAHGYRVISTNQEKNTI